MKFTTITFATLQALSCIVAAHPFIIVSTRVQDVLPTHMHQRRQGFFDSIASAVDDALGISTDDEGSTTLAPAATRTVVTLPAPVTASATASSEDSTPTSSTTDDDGDEEEEEEEEEEGDGSASPTSSIEESTSSDRSATSTESSSSAPTSASSNEPSSETLAPTTALGTASSTATSSAAASEADSNNNSSDGGIPDGGIAVAVVMILLILSVTAFLVFRYHPRCQAWWIARQEKARIERSYRDGIDGVAGLSATPSLRQQALAGGASKRRTMLHSFFAPATARLSATTEIRRKPVNWGSEPSTPRSINPPASNQTREVESEKVSMGASAAPLGQIERFSAVPAPVPVLAAVPESAHPEPLTALPAMATPQGQSRAISRSSTTKSESVPRLPANQPVSPMGLGAHNVSPIDGDRTSFEHLTPISPLSTHPKTGESVNTISNTLSGANTNPADRSLPLPPPLPAVPALAHAKRGSDGVFRLG